MSDVKKKCVSLVEIAKMLGWKTTKKELARLLDAIKHAQNFAKAFFEANQ